MGIKSLGTKEDLPRLIGEHDSYGGLITIGDNWIRKHVFEEMSASPVTALKSVFELCDSPADDELVAAIVEKHQFENLKRSRLTPAEDVKAPEGHYRQGKVGGWHREFTGLQRYLFDKVAGDLLRELGYAQRGWRAEGPHQRALLPVAAQARKLYRRGAQAGAVLLGRKNVEGA